tara:strand:+ start:7597 stop:7995 length:399 start_codon:yes stop_codon:yes gene_type:complete
MLRINDNQEMLSEFERFQKTNTNRTLHSRKNPKESSVATLALGEATGHHHSIDVMHDENKDVEVTRYFNNWQHNSRANQGLGNVPEYFEVVGSDATIKHQEHNPITLPSGIYRVRIVKEYDPFSGQISGVAD